MSWSSVAVGVVGGGLAAYALLKYRSTPKTPEAVSVNYFDIKAAPGEKLRLALTLSGVPFTDNRIKFPDWAALKPTTKFGSCASRELRLLAHLACCLLH